MKFCGFEATFFAYLEVRKKYNQIYLGKIDLLVDFLRSMSTNKTSEIPELPPQSYI